MTQDVYQHTDGYWVYELSVGESKIYQDVDFQNGGRMETEVRATELMDWQIEQFSFQTTYQEVSLQEEIILLKQENQLLKDRLKVYENAVASAAAQ